MAQFGNRGSRGVRGIRTPSPSATIIGRRVLTGQGAPQHISIHEFLQISQSMGGFTPAVPNPTGLFIHVTTDASTEISLISGQPGRVLPMLLPVGTWDLSGSVTFDPNGSSTFTVGTAAISMNPSVLPDPPNGGGYVTYTGNLATSHTLTLTTAVMRIVANPDPIPLWLLAMAIFT